MSARTRPLGLLARHLRARTGGGAVLAMITVVLAFLAALAPTAAVQLADATIRDRIDGLSGPARDLTATAGTFPQIAAVGTGLTTDEVWGLFLDAAEAIRLDADAPLPEVLGPLRAVARSVPSATDPAPQKVGVAYAPGYEEEIELSSGRLPDPAEAVAAVEIVLSDRAAEEAGWEVDTTRAVPSWEGDVDVTLVGTFMPRDPDAEYWQHTPSILDANVFDDGNAPRQVTVTGFAHPAGMGYGGAFPGTYRTDMWFSVSTPDIDAQNANAVVAALRGFTAVGHPVGESADGSGILSLRFDAGVTAELERAIAQQSATMSVVAMLIAGPLGVAVAVLVLAARLILEGRRASLRLLSARGASHAQLRGILALEGVTWATLPALAGAIAAFFVAVAVWGVPLTSASYVGAAAVGIVPVAILAVLAPAAAERGARADLDARGSRLRVIGEGVLLVLTAVAATLLFVRGYAEQPDALLAAAPLLLSLTACVLTLRLYPLPLRWLGTRAARRPGVVGFLGSARALRDPAIGITPVLALVVGVAVAVSSGVLLSVIDAGARESSRAQIGGDMRIDGAMFTAAQLEAVGDVDGVAAATGISGAETSQLSIDGRDRNTVVFVVDAAALRAVQGEGPGLLPEGAAPVAAPVSIIASGVAADAIGDAGEVELGGVPVDVAGVTRGPVPTGARENWVAIDAAAAEEVLGRDPSDRTIVVRLDAAADATAVEEAIRAIVGPIAVIDAETDVLADVQEGAAVQGVRAALGAATVLAALLSAAAVAITLVLAAAPRARIVALLRTLGAPRRVSRGLVAWEITPPAVAAVVAGTLFGALVPLVVMAAVDLRPFTGSSEPPGYAVDPLLLAATAGGFIVTAAVLTGAALLLARRTGAASALRTVEEG
ncbi:FtsX-like permease family protein [Microbacterium dauci]|uniref:ABC transporter permease n=1 Tax=Microbacterium dauci TaxID=3048008 RepID=A0ABT6ZGU8_9MICO|nr:FtsX-like permease family protein [Microbacterium sp. LX3-4]MDJ1115375.1 ABC transporter permease [Microbacterium sp. LX3-4]